MSTAATPMVWNSLLNRIRPMLSFSVAGDHALQSLAAALTLPKIVDEASPAAGACQWVEDGEGLSVKARILSKRWEWLAVRSIEKTWKKPIRFLAVNLWADSKENVLFIQNGDGFW